MAEKHREHGLLHGEPIYHGLEDEHDKLGRALLADREWMFAAFIRLSAWTLVLTFLVLAFLALTQT